MEIDLNVHKSEKHWVLVLLDRIVELAKAFARVTVLSPAKAICRIWKKVWKPLMVIVVVAVLGGIGWMGHYGYVCWSAYSRITDSLHSQNEITSIEYAKKILLEEDWGEGKMYQFNIDALLSEYYEEAFKILEDKAYQGNSEAQICLGCVYYLNRQGCINGGRVDYDKAAYWWNEAAKQNHPHALYNLGWCYETGVGVEWDFNCKKMMDCYRKSAELGDAWGQLTYGDMWLTGVNVKRSGICATSWDWEVAEWGHIIDVQGIDKYA